MLELLIIVASIVSDRITKIWASQTLRYLPGGRADLIPGIVEFRYVENRGAAFSMLSGQRWLFIVISLAVIAGLTYYLTKYRAEESIWTRIAIACIIGGAIGNLIDRFLHGYVVDMFNPTFIQFAVFNVADIFITCGTILFVFALIIFPWFKNRKK